MLFIDDMAEDSLPMQPPEPDYVSERHVLRVPINDEHFKDPWKLRLYAEKLVEDKVGDDVQLTDLKVKKPHIFAKIVAKLLGRVPEARLYVTIKF